MEENKNIGMRADIPSFVYRDGMIVDKECMNSLDMRQSFPDATGFSHTNVKYMKQWYSFYYDGFTKSHQAGDQLTLTEKSHQVDSQMEMPEIHDIAAELFANREDFQTRLDLLLDNAKKVK